MKQIFFKTVIGKEILDDYNYHIKIYSPTSKKIVGIVPKFSSYRKIDDIYNQAYEAYLSYKNVDYEIRKKNLLSFVKLLILNKEKIVEIMNWEIAKNKKLADEEVERSIEYIQLTIDEYENIMKNPLIFDNSNPLIKNKKAKFVYEPIGVILAISPFNYPLNLLISKIAPALISGNVVVFKGATQGMCLASFISTLLFEAGFKNGEIYCITDQGKEIGDTLFNNKNISMISFTGSTNVGKKIASINPMIPVVLELGGKDDALILRDVNIKEVVKKIIKGAFTYNGQRCTSIKRVLVEKSIEKEFIKELNDELEKLSIGSAIEGNFDISELISERSLNYLEELVNDAISKGAKTKQKIIKEGNIFHPMILYDVSLNSRIAFEEQFGPILPIIRFESIEEAIKISNSSQYGLQASIFTKDIEEAKKIGQKLEVVTININSTSSRGPDIFPFGGIKNSGKGLQGIKESIISMNRIKGYVENI